MLDEDETVLELLDELEEAMQKSAKNNQINT
jgi:hypothetical protein